MEQLEQIAGVRPSKDWLDACCDHLRHSSGGAGTGDTPDNVLHQILHADLRDVIRVLGDEIETENNDDTRPAENQQEQQSPPKLLRQSIHQSMITENRKIELPESFRLLLQVEELLDVSLNAEARLAIGPASPSNPTPIGNQRQRCLKMCVSDGYTFQGTRHYRRHQQENDNDEHHQNEKDIMVAMEVSPISSLSVNSKAGIKILIKGPLTIRYGVMLWHEGNATVLGGCVPSFVEIQKKALEQAKKVAGVGVDPTIRALIWNPDNTGENEEEQDDEGEGESRDLPPAPPPTVPAATAATTTIAGSPLPSVMDATTATVPPQPRNPNVGGTTTTTSAVTDAPTNSTQTSQQSTSMLPGVAINPTMSRPITSSRDANNTTNTGPRSLAASGTTVSHGNNSANNNRTVPARSTSTGEGRPGRHDTTTSGPRPFSFAPSKITTTAAAGSGTTPLSNSNRAPVVPSTATATATSSNRNPYARKNPYGSSTSSSSAAAVAATPASTVTSTTTSRQPQISQRRIPTPIAPLAIQTNAKATTRTGPLHHGNNGDTDDMVVDLITPTNNINDDEVQFLSTRTTPAPPQRQPPPPPALPFVPPQPTGTGEMTRTPGGPQEQQLQQHTQASTSSSASVNSSSTQDFETFSFTDLRVLLTQARQDRNLYEQYVGKVFVIPQCHQVGVHRNFNILKRKKTKSKKKDKTATAASAKKEDKYEYCMDCNFAGASSSKQQQQQQYEGKITCKIHSANILEPHFGLPPSEMRRLNREEREKSQKLVDAGGRKVKEYLTTITSWQMMLWHTTAEFFQNSDPTTIPELDGKEPILLVLKRHERSSSNRL